MQNPCPSCGAETFPGARFCRRCGSPVREDAGTGEASPHAATVPLAADEGRTTEGLASGEERVSPQTSRVSLAEVERLLRSQDAAPPRTPSDNNAAPAAQSSAATRPDTPAPDLDEELTITVPRLPQTREAGDFEATADFEDTRPADFVVTRTAAAPQPPSSQQATRAAPALDANDYANDMPGAAVGSGGAATPGARPRRVWPLVVAACAVVAVVAAGGAWLALSVLRRPAVTEVPTQGATAPPLTADARQQFELKLAEAESLLAGGDMEGALRRLREANLLDPANTRARWRLAELLLSTGARREAIEELRAVARVTPDDFNAWRQLAMAQSAEGLHRDAAESYRRLFALVGEQSADPADLLAYADALRISGRVEESRLVYERLAGAAPSEVAASASRWLAELARAAEPTPTPAQQTAVQAGEQSPREGEAASVVQPAAGQPPAQPPPAPPLPAPTPEPARPAAGSPAEHYGRGVELWTSNRGAALAEFRAAASGGNHDAHYYLGLAYVDGRSLSSLKRAEVVAALQHFQLAQRGGRHAAQARGYARQLEKEFDRLRRQ